MDREEFPILAETWSTGAFAVCMPSPKLVISNLIKSESASSTDAAIPP